MSATAIAQVTVALKELLKANLDSQVKVSLLQPNDALAKNSINLYLYRVIENPQLRNTTWRGDRTHPPANAYGLPLELFYLLTPFADPPASDDAQLPRAHALLGAAMQILNDHAVINDVHTAGFDFDTLASIDDLRNAFDKIIIRLQSSTTEELSKIWMMFNQPYRLSVVYQVSLVQVAPAVPARPRPAPVAVTALDVFPTDPPSLTALTPSRGPAGTTVTVEGYRLSRKSFRTLVHLAGRPIQPTTLSPERLQFVVPADLASGPAQEVRVSLDGQTSGPLTFVLAPWITRLTPQRGAPGALPTPPVEVVAEVLGEDLTAVAVAVTLGGAPVAHTVVDATHVKFTIPIAQANGLHAVQVSTGGRPSNARIFEVVPLVTDTVPDPPTPGAALRINGERLDGDAVRVDFDAAAFVIGKNTEAGHVDVKNVPRLESGGHSLRVTVDGRESNTLTFTVP